MFCTKCGKKIEEVNNFCTNCGQSIDIKENINAVSSKDENNINNNQKNTLQVNNNIVKNNQEHTSGVVIASLVIGIISSALSFQYS